MTKKIFYFLTALLMAVFVSSLPAYAADQPAGREDFYRQLADLVSKQDYSKFFDEMELQVGSDILTVDGETQVLTAAPEIINNRTMLPIRAVAEAAGAEVDWEPITSTVLIESASGDAISCSIGSSIITVNDQASQMDVTPYIKQEKNYMPVRAVSEALELDVDWDAATQTIRLTAPYQSARLIVLADQLDTQELNPETVLSDGTGMWVLQFETPTQARKAAEALENQGILAEPDRYIPPIEDDVVPEMTASGTHYTWGAADCGFDSFVSKYAGQFTGNGVVAVVDTGVDSSHSFLQGRVLSDGYDFIDGDRTPNDGNSHGTHVAGTIIDCVGSAPVSILPVRVLNNQGQGTDVTVAAGVKYAADHGADVINLSLGGRCSKAKDNAISYALTKGCLVVAAAENDNRDTADSCPAHITAGGAVIVSAGDSSHKKASFSNYGSSVDLMAPGVGIKATIPGGGFGSMNGTSMATPHAAAAAMLIDLAWSETLAPAALEKELYSATTYGKWTNSTVGSGFLDLNRASVPSPNITPKVSLNRTDLSLKAGESQTLTASVTPSGTAVSWNSSDTSVAAVSGGKVTAVGQGTATITAQIVSNGTVCQAKCTVTVAAAVSPKISLSRSSLSLKVGESQTLTTSVTPSGTAVNWSSNNTDVATVSGGKVTAVSQGTATITAQIVYNGASYQAKCTVTVNAKGEVLVPNVIGMEQTEATKLLTDRGLQFQVWWVDGETEAEPYYVIEQSIPAGSTTDAGTLVRLRLTSVGISLNNSSLSLKTGESQTLTASVTPSGTAVSWSSSNTDVATVSGGKVTAVGQGTTTITAQISYGGRSYSSICRVSVAKASLGISVEAYNTTMNVGDSQTLRVITTEPNFDSLVATSSNTSVATVDGNSGVVTAVGAGTVTITITISKTVNGITISGSDSCTISVKGSAYTFGMQMTIIADDATVSALKRAGFNMNSIVDTAGYTWRYNSDGYFHCDTSTSVSYNTLKTISGMEFWDFQYSDLAAQLYPYGYGTEITTAVTSGQPNPYTLGIISIRGFSHTRI